MSKIYSVADINKYIKSVIEGQLELRNIQVAGELSNFKRYPSGHCYFNLKDASGVLKGVMWRYRAVSMSYEPQNGDKVVAIGRIRVYERDGVYQLEADILQPQGRGDLMVEYERLKARLGAEGLFESSRKQELPENPHTLGIITSPAGAAVRDIITVARRRNPGIKLYLYPVKVQGKEASEEIARAISFFNRTKLAEVLIVGRGGGSIEDLWAFNEEKTIRAVAASTLPIVSAVGHETDFTLCDFAADKRAATPSQAAEIAVADVEKLLQNVHQRAQRLQLLIEKQLEQLEFRMERCTKSWALTEPTRLLQSKSERLKRALSSRMLQDPGSLYAAKEEKLARLLASRALQEPELLFAAKEQRLDMAMQDLQQRLQEQYRAKEHSFELLGARLSGLNPLAVLARGYSVSQVNKKVLTSVEQVAWGEEIVTELADGRIYSVVQQVERAENGN